MVKRIRFLFTLIVTLGVMLAGCEIRERMTSDDAASQMPTKQMENVFPETDMVAKFVTLSREKYSEYGNVHFFADNLLCRSTVLKEYNVCGVGMFDNAGNVSNLIDPSKGVSEPPYESVLTFCNSEEGEVHAVIASQETKDGERWQYGNLWLVRYDKAGMEQSRVSMQAENNDVEDLRNAVMEMDKDGNYLIAQKDIWIYSADGSRKGELRLGEESDVRFLTKAADGNVYAVIMDARGSSLGLVNVRQGRVEEIAGAPDSMLGIGATDRENALLIYDQEGLWQFDLKGKTMTPMLCWTDRGIYGRNVMGVRQYAERILAYCNDVETVEMIILKPGEEKKKEPQKLVIYSLYDDIYLSPVISAFNRSQSDWKVVVKTYGEAQAGARDSLNKMMISVLGSDPPDLINIDYVFESSVSPTMSDLTEQGYVEDLGPYLSKSTEISVADLEQKALDCCTIRGKLVAIPRMFSLQALMVSEEEWQGQDCWSIADLIAYDRARPAKELLSNCTSGELLTLIAYYSISDFVDLNGKEVNLDTPEFRELMEHAATYPADEIGKRSYDVFKFQWQPVKRPLMRVAYYSNFASIPEYGWTYFGGNGKVMGFPNEGRKFLTSIKPQNSLLSICAKSKNKEGAWKFIEFMLNYDQDCLGPKILGIPGFPCNKKILQKQMELLCAEDGILRGIGDANHPEDYYFPYSFRCFDEDGQTYEVPRKPLTEEEVILYYKILEGASYDYCWYADVRTILQEESEAYFAGQKGLDETIDVMEKRIRLYLREQ